MTNITDLTWKIICGSHLHNVASGIKNHPQYKQISPSYCVVFQSIFIFYLQQINMCVTFTLFPSEAWPASTAWKTHVRPPSDVFLIFDKKGKISHAAHDV